MRDNAQNGMVPVPPGAYVRTGPQTPFPIPLTPYPPYVLPGNQNQYSLRQPIAQAIAAFGDYMDDLTPTQTKAVYTIGGFLLGAAAGFAASHFSKKRK